MRLEQTYYPAMNVVTILGFQFVVADKFEYVTVNKGGYVHAWDDRPYLCDVDGVWETMSWCEGANGKGTLIAKLSDDGCFEPELVEVYE